MHVRLLAVGIFAFASMAVPAAEPIVVGDELQLFLDEHLIETKKNVELRLHEPRRAEIVLRRDRPYEDAAMYDPTVIKDGDRYRMWYRANFNRLPYYMAYAESSDGIHWTKPDLGLVEIAGSKANNVVFASKNQATPYVWSVFKDGNPKVAPEERYKAVGRAIVGGKDGAGAMVSPDGL